MLVDGTGSFAIARAAGFRMLVMSRIRHAAIQLRAGQKKAARISRKIVAGQQ